MLAVDTTIEQERMSGARSARRARRILIVAPHFPPSGMPPSHRARQFATHLLEYGWHPTVLTVRPEFYQEAHEPELCELVPDGVDVIRTGAIPPKRPGGVGIGDLGLRVLFHQAGVISRICRARSIDLVYLLCPPNHQLPLGRLVHARTGVPYVIDYIDPWLSVWLEQHARPFTKLWAVHQIAKHLEPFCVARAAGITSVSQGTTDGVLRHYPHLTADRGLSIPYGAEPDVYDRVRASISSPPDVNSPRTLLYLGAMWEAAYPTLRAFLAALGQLKAREPALYANCRVNFVGTSYAPDAAADRKVAAFADAAGVSDAVTETPHRLPFLKAVAALASADTLLMLGSSEAHYTPSRLLPYVFARRPMLVLMHEASDAIDHLRHRDAVRLITYNAVRPPGDIVEEIYGALRTWATEDRRPDLALPGPEWNPYTTRALTGKLASFLDDLVERSGRTTPHTLR